MENKKIQYFKNKLLNEKKQLEKTIESFRKEELNNSLNNELSNYDNHPSDTAEEVFQKGKDVILKKNEENILNKINDAIKNIEEGKYGICKSCGKPILEQRLEVIPYTEYCARCKNELSKDNNFEEKKDIKDKIARDPYLNGFNSISNKVEFDGEDSYQSVERFNRMNKIYEFYSYNDLDEYYDENVGCVEDVESISNEEYKKGLPD